MAVLSGTGCESGWAQKTQKYRCGGTDAMFSAPWIYCDGSVAVGSRTCAVRGMCASASMCENKRRRCGHKTYHTSHALVPHMNHDMIHGTSCLTAVAAAH